MAIVCKTGSTATSNRSPVTFKVGKKLVKGKTYYEATALLNGFAATKLRRIGSDCTLFATTQAIVSACNARANEYNRSADIILPKEKVVSKTKKVKS